MRVYSKVKCISKLPIPEPTRVSIIEGGPSSISRCQLVSQDLRGRIRGPRACRVPVSLPNLEFCFMYMVNYKFIIQSQMEETRRQLEVLN